MKMVYNYNIFARLKGLKSFQSKLEEITDNKDWIREGSLCCPRLVFVFSGLSAASDVRNS